MTITFVTEPTAYQGFSVPDYVSPSNKGTNTADCVINVTATASPLEVRLVDPDDSNNPITDWVTITSGVDTAIDVPANDTNYIIEARENGSGNTYSTNYFACGIPDYIGGQSLANAMITALSGGTLASNGITPHPAARAFCRTSAESTPAWVQISDSTYADSAFAAEYLNERIAQTGVAVFLVGVTVGATSIGFFTPTGTYWSDTETVLNEVGYVANVIWYHGHNNVGNVTVDYANQVRHIIYGLEAISSKTIENIFIGGIPNLASGSFGTAEELNDLRAGMKFLGDRKSNWYYTGKANVELGDNIHQTQTGNRSIAADILRHQYGSPGGPVLASVSLDGDVATATITLPAGATALSKTGSGVYVNYCLESDDTLTTLAIDTEVVNTDTIVTTFTSTPAGPVRALIGSDITVDGSTYITDNYSDDYYGSRGFEHTIVERDYHRPDNDFTESGSLTYASDDGVTPVSGGYLIMPYDTSLYCPPPCTYEMILTTTTTSQDVFLDLREAGWIEVRPGGFVRASFTGTNIQTVLAINDGDPHHVALCVDVDGNIEIFVDGVSDATGAKTLTRGLSNTPALLRYVPSATFNYDGSVKDLAVYDIAKYTDDYTPTDVDTADEDLWAYYPLTTGPEAAEIGTPAAPVITCDSSWTLYENYSDTLDLTITDADTVSISGITGVIIENTSGDNYTITAPALDYDTVPSGTLTITADNAYNDEVTHDISVTVVAAVESILNDTFSVDESPFDDDLIIQSDSNSEITSGLLQQIASDTSNTIAAKSVISDSHGVNTQASYTTDYTDVYDATGGLELLCMYSSDDDKLSMYFDLDGSNVDLNVDQVVGGSTTTHTIATFTASDLGTSPFEYRIHVAKVGTSAWVYPMFNQEIPSGLTDTWPFEISTVGLETGAPGIVLKESSGGDSVKSTRMALDQYFEHTTWDDGEDPDGTTANAGYNHITHSSSTMGIDVGIAVITPPNYSVNKSYGCLIFLHGSGGNENILVAASTTPPAEHAFDYMDGGGTEYIICSVNAGLSLYLDPVSGSIEDGHDVRSFITGELLTYLSNNWSVDTDRIVIGGFSMGCYGAMSIWLDNRDKFIGCAGFSPPVQPDFEQQYLAERKSILNYQPGTTGRTNVEAANLYTQIVSAGTPEFFIRTSDADSTNALFNSWKTVAQSNGATFDHTIYSGLPHSIDQQMDQDASDGYEYWTYVGDTVGDPVDIDVDSNILLSGRMTSRMTERLI